MIKEEDLPIAVEIHRGNRKAMECLVREYEDKLFTYAFYMIKQDDEAKDIIQEAFIKAYSTLTGQYDEQTCLTLAVNAWLFRIVRNMSLNRIRSYRRRQKAHEEIGNTENERVFPQNNQTSVGVMKFALQKLGQDSRELITLRFIDDLRYSEIVAIVGTTESAVRGKIYRILKKLRKLMEDT
jgi:RNA polymerase sigma-70 factor, ECF subfamily